MLYLTIIFITAFTIFITPGIFLCRFMYNLNTKELFFIGSPLGIGISCLLSAIIAFFWGFNPYYFIITILSSTIFLLFAKKKSKENLLTNINFNTNKILSYSIISVSILLTISYSNFGKLTANGYIFKDLFATDLLHHMSVFVRLPKGIPPQNPYFSDGLWNYYWISHIFPAFVYSLSGFKLFSRDIMVLTSLTYSVLFIGTLFYLITTFYDDNKIIILLMTISLVAYGYNDIFVLFKYIVLRLPESWVKFFHLNYFIMDAYGGQYTGYSHGWFRNLLVEPHSTLALSLLFILIILMKRHTRTSIKTNYLFQGLLLGIILSCDAFIGTISICWYMTNFFIELWIKKRNESFTNFIISLIPIVLIFITLCSLKILNPGSNHLVFKPYYKMIICSPLYFLIDYGPMSIFGAIGIFLLIKTKNLKYFSSLIILIIICLFFMFFVNVADVGSTQMIRKGGMAIRIPLIIFSGISLTYLFEKHHRKRSILVILTLVLALAIPTPFNDIYMLSDIKAKSGIYSVKMEDFKAYQWIRKNLPLNCIIQDFPTGITPLLAFAERRVCLGDWEHARASGAGAEKVAKRFNDIRRLFKTNDLNLAINIIKKYQIDYIYVNLETRQKFIEGCKKFDAYQKFFKKVYSQDGISIYKVSF